MRTLRDAQRLARHALAHRSGVSERYIARLEGGTGNMSILLLRRVAQALGMSAGELLADGRSAPGRPSGGRPRGHRVALLGLRGAGKSTLGALLAKHRGVAFVELDAAVEAQAGMSLPEVFACLGQAGYRRLERQCLEHLLGQDQALVIAAGGGMVSEPSTFALLRSHCLTAWLRASPEEHMARVVGQGDLRPMAGRAEAMADLRRILEARAPLYAQADWVVDTSGQGVDRSLEQLVQMLGREPHPRGDVVNG